MAQRSPDERPVSRPRVSPSPPRAVALRDVAITEELTRRTPRPPDREAETAALHALARLMADRPDAVLRGLAEAALALCAAGTAGVSLLETPAGGEPVFRWAGLAGACKGSEGGTTPADFSPCGTCLKRRAPQLYSHPARHFTCLRDSQPAVVEGLVVPLTARGRGLGTIWVAAHDERRKFDAEDVRVLSGLADFTAAALERDRLNDELRRQAEELRAVDRRRDQFLAQLGHELRNPLAPLANALRLLRLRGADAAERGQTLGLAERQVDQLTGLIDGLLDVSRIREGKIHLRREVLDLTRVVAAAVEAVSPLVGGGHDLQVTAPAGPVLLQADPGRLQQVFVNLLVNACKYTEAGGRIRVAVEREDGLAVARVRDSGIGLAAELLPRLFDLYAQAEGAWEHSRGGLGIGLSLVRSLVELHGGTVGATSEGRGRGSEFVVRLPALPEGTPAEPAPGSAEGPGEGRRLRVLVVDDSLDGAESLALLLRMWSYEVEIAHDGPAALEAARSFRPECVLLDIGMSGMDGREVCRRLRRQAGMRQPFLIALTGFGGDQESRLSRESGFDLHWVKPVDLDALRQALAGVGAKARRPAQAPPSGATP